MHACNVIRMFTRCLGASQFCMIASPTAACPGVFFECYRNDNNVSTSMLMMLICSLRGRATFHSIYLSIYLSIYVFHSDLGISKKGSSLVSGQRRGGSMKTLSIDKFNEILKVTITFQCNSCRVDPDPLASILQN